MFIRTIIHFTHDQSCMNYPYMAFLNGTGLTIRLLRINWHTTALNRSVVKWTSKYPRLLNASFDLGVWASIVVLPVAITLHFIYAFVQHSIAASSATTGSANSAASAAQSSGLGIELMLPGVNLPLDEIGYYVGALAVCTVLHELGHAAAAVLVDVPITAFGFQLFAVFPMAYTELASEKLYTLRLWHKLRVLCAGIWHNMLLAAAAWTMLTALGVLLLPWFTIGDGVIVTHVQRNSLLSGERGLQVNDVVRFVNGCAVRDRDAWYACLWRTIREPPAYCVDSDYILQHDESVPAAFRVGTGANHNLVECCNPSSPMNVCFEHAADDELNNELAEIPQHVCLHARRAIEKSRGFCGAHAAEQEARSSNNLVSGSPLAAAHCVDSFCLRPQLGNGTTILQIVRDRRHASASAAGGDMLYIGHPADISRTVRVSEFVPKVRWLRPGLADGLARLLRYVVVFSLGLAVVNVLPCYAFDGQHIVSALVQHGLLRAVPDRARREWIAFGVTTLGTVAFGATLVRVIWATWTKNMY